MEELKKNKKNDNINYIKIYDKSGFFSADYDTYEESKENIIIPRINNEISGRFKISRHIH